MSTLVCFHAHPDDESIATGGVMAKAAKDGHRVVLVIATMGEVGEVDDGVLGDGESLGDRRRAETHRSADILGTERVEFLGYRDSGMVDEPTNDHPDCFWQADVDEAAERLAAILRDVDADVLTVYDEHGNYGHPDHIQVHRVGLRAAELAGVEEVYEATMNRDHLRRMLEHATELGLDVDDAPDTSDASEFGTPEALITHGIPVGDFTEAKRASMAAHASQIGDDHMFLSMPMEQFSMLMGTEWFIHHGNPRAEGQPVKTELI